MFVYSTIGCPKKLGLCNCTCNSAECILIFQDFSYHGPSQFSFAYIYPAYTPKYFLSPDPSLLGIHVTQFFQTVNIFLFQHPKIKQDLDSSLINQTQQEHLTHLLKVTPLTELDLRG